MFGGASTALPADEDTRFIPGAPVRPFSYPPKVS
jgi:hypothetical protein